MRRKLKKLGSKDRHRFRAEFVQLDDKPAWKGTVVVIVLRNVRLVTTGERIANRVSFTWGTVFQRLGRMEAGHEVEFDARVVKRRTGYRGPDYLLRAENPPRTVWKLSHPSRVQRILLDGSTQAHSRRSSPPALHDSAGGRGGCHE
jgi:hypothetical protein